MEVVHLGNMLQRWKKRCCKTIVFEIIQRRCACWYISFFCPYVDVVCYFFCFEGKKQTCVIITNELKNVEKIWI